MTLCGSLTQIISVIILTLGISKINQMAWKKINKHLFGICYTSDTSRGWRDLSEQKRKKNGKNDHLHVEYIQMQGDVRL